MAQPTVLSPGGYVRQGQRNTSPPRSVNVQVAVRCRPINEREQSHAERPILSCHEGRREVVFNTLSTSTSTSTSQRKTPLTSSSNLSANKRTFTYDHVFDQNATQADLYDRLIEPIVDEVLQGYNCTVFAYGQTGTGKTHTMEGGRSSDIINHTSNISEHAGIIPRSIKQIFDYLRSLTDEHSVRVSHLELYNEQLTDLLSPEDAELRVYEDQHKGTFVQGLEDTVVRDEEEIFSILDKSASKRKTAETAMNKYSSRSHSIFSITIHIKESTPDGADLLKVGKLNLVDLAGSENIGRSGAIKGRAREAGNINQSLLTLGRVITALVDRHPHIPYRDSKLTRLLQESLGGRNKTCVIATVTSASGSIEETLSTLDYAYRAKSIKNRPTVNQMIAKHVLLKEYTDEISKLKRELDATREKNGVYLPAEEFEKLQKTTQSQSSAITDLEIKSEEYEKKISIVKTKLDKTQQALERDQKVLANTRISLENVSEQLERTKENLSITIQQRDENSLLVKQHVITERTLRSQGNQLQSSLKETLDDVGALHERVDVKSRLEDENINMINVLKVGVSKYVSNICSKLDRHRSSHKRTTDSASQVVGNAREEMENVLSGIISEFENLKHCLQLREESETKFVEQADETMEHEIKEISSVTKGGLQKYIVERCEQHERVKQTCNTVVKLFEHGVIGSMNDIQQAVNQYADTIQGTLAIAGDEQKEMLQQLEEQVFGFAEKQKEFVATLSAVGERDTNAQLDALRNSKAVVIDRISAVMDELIGGAVSRTGNKIREDKELSDILISEGLVLNNNVSCSKGGMIEKYDESTKLCNESGIELKNRLSNVLERTENNIVRNGMNEIIKMRDESQNIFEMKTNEELKQGINGNGLDKITTLISTKLKESDEHRLKEYTDRNENIQDSIGNVRSCVKRCTDDGNTRFEKMIVGLRECDEGVVDMCESIRGDVEDGVGKNVTGVIVACDEEDELRPGRKELPVIVDVTLAKTRNHTSLVIESRSQRRDVRNEVEIEDFGHAVARTPDRVQSDHEEEEEKRRMSISDEEQEQPDGDDKRKDPIGNESGSESSISAKSNDEENVVPNDRQCATSVTENVLSDVSNRRTGRSRAVRRIEPVIKKPSGIPAPRTRTQRRLQLQ